MQTAVEWLLNELIFKQDYEHLPNNYFLMSDKDIDTIIEQAKEMERQAEISDKEILDAAEDYSDSYLNKGVAMSSFARGCYWYREQLKARQ